MTRAALVGLALPVAFALSACASEPQSEACQRYVAACAAGNCSHTNAIDGGACTDNNLCTGADSCVSGKCAGVPAVSCDDGNACTTDACAAATGQCSNVPIAGCGTVCKVDGDCNDGNSCTTEVCGNGKCVITMLNAVSCEDGNACTTLDSCSAGVCTTGKDVPCPQNNTCAVNACNKASGECVATPVADGATCSDNTNCTTGDKCTSGKCGGSLVTCNDGNPCTADACSANNGVCQFQPIPNCGANCASDAGELQRGAAVQGEYRLRRHQRVHGRRLQPQQRHVHQRQHPGLQPECAVHDRCRVR